ncbi:hypothetical protein PTD2_02876 [Pseudoalteromonas tunicata D2]|uniref:Uncharacterized protein n=1 Tax=Pseudoalteromonas tunicata D2 TaxID=87626 RepID=A4C4J6_9GAMM|nr:hypothetical protein PTD2_02876 [Pseudoalteromonas tunicata D2]
MGLNSIADTKFFLKKVLFLQFNTFKVKKGP